jgi:hypothetical protein
MNQFDTWMQKSLQDGHEMPTPEDLRAMEHLLNQRDNKRRGAWWWWTGALGIVLLAGAVIWWNAAGAHNKELQQPAAKIAERSSLWNHLAIQNTSPSESEAGQSQTPLTPKDLTASTEVYTAETQIAQTIPHKKRNTTSKPSDTAENSSVKDQHGKKKEKEKENTIENQTEPVNSSQISTTSKETPQDNAIVLSPDSMPTAHALQDTASLSTGSDSIYSERISPISSDSLPARKRRFEIQGGVSLAWPSLQNELSYARGGLKTRDHVFLVSQDISLRMRVSKWQFGIGLSVMRYNPGFVFEPIAASDLTVTGEGQEIQFNFIEFPEIMETAENYEAITRFDAWTIPFFAGYVFPLKENRVEIMPRAGLAISFQSRETLTYTERWVLYYDIPQIEVYEQREYFPIIRANRKQSTNLLAAAELRFILPKNLILITEPGVWLDPGASASGVWTRSPYFRFSVGYSF